MLKCVIVLTWSFNIIHDDDDDDDDIGDSELVVSSGAPC